MEKIEKILEEIKELTDDELITLLSNLEQVIIDDTLRQFSSKELLELLALLEEIEKGDK